MTQTRNIIIAGGKTGGHLFPGIAVAQALKKIDPTVNILFVGTNAPFEVNTLKTYGFAHKPIIARPIKGGSLGAKAWSSALVLVSLVQSLALLIRFRADFILGVGGFSSFSLVLAARLLGRQCAIQEQNAFPGMTNRLLSKFAHTIFTAFETTRGLDQNPKTRWVGNPIRESSSVPETQGSLLEDVRDDDFLILVTGGSQGAASINQAFTRAARSLGRQEGVVIIHQTGAAEEQEVARAYRELGIRATARAFIHEMPALQDRADLVVSRAGAGALSELCIKGKPAVLIPFPYAADDHQTANANNLSDQGAALLIHDRELTGDLLKTTIERLINDPEKLAKMAGAARALAMPHGARIIADHILNSRNKERR